MKFKVGDKVSVVARRGGFNGSSSVGDVGVVGCIQEKDDSHPIRVVDLDGTQYSTGFNWEWFNEDEIELVSHVYTFGQKVRYKQCVFYYLGKVDEETSLITDRDLTGIGLVCVYSNALILRANTSDLTPHDAPVKMTVAEVCEKLGYTIEITK